MWFRKLVGFDEETPDQVRDNLLVDGQILKSRVNGREFRCGLLEIPSLAELRTRVDGICERGGSLSVSEVVADVRDLHADTLNAGALFQVASQFNLLEMISPDITPEQGVDRYEYDHTQGPACAIAAGAGTIYRNYFAEVNGRVGQTADNQIDCLADLGNVLENSGSRLWQMRNGYALASEEGLREIDAKLESATDRELDALRGLLRIGLQHNVEVTIADSGHTVSQAYCSALPVAYSHCSSALWKKFSRLILEASYEAVFCAAVLNAAKTGCARLYLTLLGGGAFGNRTEWITDALSRSLNLFCNFPLDIVIVSYGHSDPCTHKLIQQFSITN